MFLKLFTSEPKMIRRCLLIVLSVGVIAVAGATWFLFGDREWIVKEATSPDHKMIAEIRRIQKSQWGNEPDLIEIAIDHQYWFKTTLARQPYESFLDDFDIKWGGPKQVIVFYSTDDAGVVNKPIPAVQRLEDVQIKFTRTAAWVSSKQSGTSSVLTAPDFLHEATLKVSVGTDSAPRRLELRMNRSQGGSQADFGLVVFDEEMCNSPFPYGARWSSPTSLDLYVPDCRRSLSELHAANRTIGDVVVRTHRSNGSL